MPAEPVPHVRVLVIGAGFGGLAMAIKLEEAGEHDFVVVERGPEVGGTWRDNTYPGAACDIPSQLYSYSFALNPNWSRTFSRGPEIQDYLRTVAKDSGVLDRFRFGTKVESATWDETRSLWRVETTNGSWTANVVVSAAGALSDPKLPDIDGLDSFAGEIFHSSRWNHDLDLTGKRVAVIGTGASAIQIVPAIAPLVAHLDVYQRTAPWVIPKIDREYTRLEKLAFHNAPALQRVSRGAIYASKEALVPAITWQPKLAKPAELLARANIRVGIKNRVLRESVTPDFEIGCKRILLSNDYYPALARDNVDVVTDGIDKVTPHAVVTRDGTEREVDAIIVCTGFHATDLPITNVVAGRDGTTMAAYFRDHGMQAYKGSTVHGFPNFFFIFGPNTVLAHSSMVYMIESQVAYIVDAVSHMKTEGIASVEPTAAAQKEYVDRLQRRMRRTVWSTGGCQSWYMDEHGRNTSTWPMATFTYRRMTAAFDAENYETHSVDRVPAG